MAKCPRCGGRVELFAGGYFGLIYQCKECGYRGVVVVEVEPADFEMFWGVSVDEVWREIVDRLPEDSGIRLNSGLEIYDRSRAAKVIDKIVKDGLSSLPPELSRKLRRNSVIDKLFGNPLRNIFIKMLIESAWRVKVESRHTNKR